MTAEWGMFWIAVVTFMLSGCGATGAVCWFVSQVIAKQKSDLIALIEEQKKEQNIKNDQFVELMNAVKKEQDDKRGRIYERFDEYKTHIEKDMIPKCVQIEYCALKHSGNQQALEFLKNEVADVKTELKELKNLLMKK